MSTPRHRLADVSYHFRSMSAETSVPDLLAHITKEVPIGANVAIFLESAPLAFELKRQLGPHRITFACAGYQTPTERRKEIEEYNATEGSIIIIADAIFPLVTQLFRRKLNHIVSFRTWMDERLRLQREILLDYVVSTPVHIHMCPL